MAFERPRHPEAGPLEVAIQSFLGCHLQVAVVFDRQVILGA
jgi:hypothetical protein